MTGSAMTPSGRTRDMREAALRPLGPQGEGWIGIQMLFEVGALVLASLTQADVGGPLRVALVVVGIALVAGGVGMFAWGASYLGRVFSVWVTPRPDGHLVTDGPYRWMRHPVCTGQVLIVAGWSIACASLLGLCMVPVVAVYLDRFKLAREEQTLLAKYGDAYRGYQRLVPHRMLPRRPASPLLVTPPPAPGH